MAAIFPTHRTGRTMKRHCAPPRRTGPDPSGLAHAQQAPCARTRPAAPESTLVPRSRSTRSTNTAAFRRLRKSRPRNSISTTRIHPVLSGHICEQHQVAQRITSRLARSQIRPPWRSICSAATNSRLPRTGRWTWGICTTNIPAPKGSPDCPSPIPMKSTSGFPTMRGT